MLVSLRTASIREAQINSSFRRRPGFNLLSSLDSGLRRNDEEAFDQDSLKCFLVKINGSSANNKVILINTLKPTR